MRMHNTSFAVLKKYMIRKIVKQGITWFSNMQIRYFKDLCEPCLNSPEKFVEFLSIYILLTPVWLVFIPQYFSSPVFLGSRLTYELTFADYSDVIKASDPDASYTISNISLEFDTVTNTSLASQIRTECMKRSILYDRILRSRIIPLNNSDTVDINSP